MKLLDFGSKPWRWVNLGIGLLATCIAWVILSPDNRDRRFLESAGSHIKSVIGLESIRQVAQKLKIEIDTDKDKGRIDAKDLPKIFEQLFPKARVKGRPYFDDKDLCDSIEISWGGSFYEWGLEVRLSPEFREREWRVMSTPLADDVVLFVD
ncbi:MAG: hypothetical protein IH623_24395 [Verrucomicrobia bacterium]|nr:hypothetical protein [Verrucomicrobiota bacterium]